MDCVTEDRNDVWMVLVPREGLVPVALVDSLVMLCDSKVLLVVFRVSIVGTVTVVVVVDCESLGGKEENEGVDVVRKEVGNSVTETLTDDGIEEADCWEDVERSIILVVLVSRLLFTCSVVVVCVSAEIIVVVTIVDNISEVGFGRLG